ncbi:uracil-DNA glycosylase family protein [Parasphingorhabdus sp.]|uniref:uracil-DNA glycosylase family protein n=1 Tax=Parasphingorhabdus sp. TaxID=2709688 RepID=UPI002F95313F
MTLSTLENPENTYAEQISSLRHWWNLAGVDLHYHSEPTSLFEPVKSEHRTKPVQPVRTSEASPKENRPQPNNEDIQPQNFSEDYPAGYDEFLAWLSLPDNLIEAQWSRQYVLPAGVIGPEIMIIAGMPDQEGLGRNSLFSEKSSILLANMLKAIGIDSEQTYTTPVSLTRSFDGRIDAKYHDILKKRMLHLLGLVQPKRIILFGETSTQLFFNENLLAARKKLQFINHFSFKTKAIVTFHPRILNERPEFKTEAWKDLQLLSRGNQ